MTRYVIDDAHELSRVLMEIDGEGNVKSRYIYGLGLIGREDADGTYLSYHYDLRGSTTLLTDEQNRVTDRYTYGLYGELEQHEGLTQQPFAYNGRAGVMTDANGLYYMRARYYDPKLKRFLNRDVIRGEIQDGQTFNRYAYVNGNPVSYIDPLGLSKWETKSEGTDEVVRKTGAYNSSNNGQSGQGLGKLEGKELNVSEKGLNIVKEHLSQNFGDFPENLAMIKRLEDALANKKKISGADSSFYMHEVSESTMMKKGIDYDTAHEMALQKYDVSRFSVYHADIIKSMPDIFNKNWRKFWGLDE
ncbi:RHS repeat domain-containing protein [Paenibacillus amylolyticus]|uniref:RHS repeat domain-containing protein n=1 Tax=Paenibacillus amylolyticus TaxID=1451 RepID=UPI00339A4F30